LNGELLLRLQEKKSIYHPESTQPPELEVVMRKRITPPQLRRKQLATHYFM